VWVKKRGRKKINGKKEKFQGIFKKPGDNVLVGEVKGKLPIRRFPRGGKTGGGKGTGR